MPLSAVEVKQPLFFENSFKQYDNWLKKWFYFWRISFNIFNISVSNIIQLLNEVYQSGAWTSTLNTYRSSLDLILGHQIGEDDLIKRFLKGLFR